MDIWYEGLQAVFSGWNPLYLLIGTIFGLIIGALPGLGPMFAVSLALPLTFTMPVESAIIMLAAIHASTAYGDSIASILINTPGGVASVASCWDGYPLTQQGRSGYALGISTGGSFAGGVIGWLSLVAIAPILMALALRMGPPEYFMVALLALSLLSMASQGQTIKGLIIGGIGLLVSFIGRDLMTATARYTFGNQLLEDGIPMSVAFLGLFALSQAIVLFEKGGSVMKVTEKKGRVLHGIKEVVMLPLTTIRAGIIGIILGVLPALGATTATIVAYLVEKRAAKHPETFGHGNPAGLLAPEVAKNCCVVGDLIPTFTLGIPGSGVTALFMAALVMHGIQPGPDFFSKGALSYTVFVGILFAQISFFILGLLFSTQLCKVVQVPNQLLVPIITVLCFLGAFAARNFIIDIFIMILFGILGYILIRAKWPLACFVLGFVLGPLAETNFHRTLMIGGDSYMPFVTRPGSLALLLTTILMLLWPYISPLIAKPKILAEANSIVGDDDSEN